jgi:hypothetical protein
MVDLVAGDSTVHEQRSPDCSEHPLKGADPLASMRFARSGTAWAPDFRLSLTHCFAWPPYQVSPKSV